MDVSHASRIKARADHVPRTIMSRSRISQQASTAVRAATHSLRSVHSSSTTRAASAIETPLALAPIVDIFDASARLCDSHTRRPHASSPSTSGRNSLNPIPTMHTSLPNPLVFEGPSGRRPVVRSHHELSQQWGPPFGSRKGSDAGAAPAVTMFDGPAHSGGWPQAPTPSQKGTQKSGGKQMPDGRNVQLALGAATATAVTFRVAHS
ncbi:hypothetical protein DFH07DRAFT_73793 [Mycena maculata]|uniref:Uncharacterized protein n=1 Tax=Mycena maculata TaxID=230809 RepID=A0AAD7K0X5_9AGAR|nr:hypothetical protein DFH07DRAFT_73793 [Mycena maculata]